MQQLQKEVEGRFYRTSKCDNGDHELCNPKGHLALTLAKLVRSVEGAFVGEGLIMGPSNLRPPLESSFFFFWKQFCVVSKVVMIHRKI